MRSGVGVETCSLLSAEGNAFGGLAGKRVSLYPRRAIHSVEWRGNVFPCIRGGQCSRWRSVETCFLVYAEGNVLCGVAWKRGPLYPRRAMRSGEWRRNVVPCIRGGQSSRWSGVETWFLVATVRTAHGGVPWSRVCLYPKKAMR